MELQSVPQKHARNVRKQAEQIRYCLIQAAEYFAAAETVSLATKPLLLYYGTMSLALAEILFKQDGGSSLDIARGQNAHHGLTLRVERRPNLLKNLSESALALGARPLIREGNSRFGTFELWHRSSRETPCCGLVKNLLDNGGTNEGTNVLMVAADERLPAIPDEGLSLLDCFRALPGMIGSLAHCGVSTELVRVRLRVHNQGDNSSSFQILIQPTAQELLERFLPLVKFKEYTMEQVLVRDLPNSLIVDVNSSPNNPGPKNKPAQCRAGDCVRHSFLYKEQFAKRVRAALLRQVHSWKLRALLPRPVDD